MDKKILFIFLYIFTLLPQAISASLLIGDKPSSALVQVFNILGIKTDGTAQSLNKIAQKDFLRKSGQERWEMGKKYDDKRDQLLPVFKELGVIDVVWPSAQQYQHIIIHGSTVTGMRQRLAFLNVLWNQGIRGENIVFFVGERPLDPKKESRKILLHQKFSDIPFREGWQPPEKMPKTEADAAVLLWDQIISNEDLRIKNVLFIRVPMIRGSETGKLRRAQTKDTIEAWLDKSPISGKCLAISNNPYIPYQDQTMLKTLCERNCDRQLQVETVGAAADTDISVAVHMDNIARWLYTELQMPSAGKD